MCRSARTLRAAEMLKMPRPRHDSRRRMNARPGDSRMISFRDVAAMAMFIVAAASRAATPAPADIDYPGTLKLAVDATDIDHRVFRVREEIPVAAGALTLLYPQWLPGNHGAARTGRQARRPHDHRRRQAARVVARFVRCLRVSSRRARRRDDARRRVRSSCRRRTASQGRVVMTPEMLNLQWNTVVLYPAGHYASRINVAPSAKLPAGWKFATALDGAGATSRRRQRRVQAGQPRSAGRFADDRGPLVQAGRSRSRCEGAGAPGHRRRRGEGSRAHRRAS